MSDALRLLSPAQPRRPRARRAGITAALVASGALLSIGTGSALADGGASIAAAPVVAFGQQQFGNTSTGGHDSNCGRSWWNVQLQSGDSLTVDWEGQASGTELVWFQPGTTDFNFQNQSHDYDDLESNNKSEFKTQAKSTGTYVMEFYNCSSYSTSFGPYDFTASVLHGVALGLPVLTALPQNGTVAVGVHTPDGTALSGGVLSVSLQATVHNDSSSPWTTIGTANPVAGTATIGYGFPNGFQGKTIDVRAISTGAGYTDAASPSQTITGPPIPTPAPAPAPTPAPPAPTTRSVTISHKSGRYRGRVSSSAKQCYRGVTVTLYRQGKPQAYGSAVTRQDGSFTISHKKLKGKAFVALPAATVGSYACSSAASKAIKH